VVAVVAVVLVVERGPSSKSVAESERQLRSGFLQPLNDAGLTFEVLDACHYARTSQQDAWHLAVKIAVDASVPDVADTLAQHVVVVADRDQPVVQQFRGQPGRGWNGIIEAPQGRTLVELAKNNVHTSEASIGVGWMSVCPESRDQQS
jgi:hypothetical protein